MTERERWTVYPLLFLSLGIAMRSKITSSLDLHEMTCHTLKSREVEIVGEDGGVRLVLKALPLGAGGGGAVQILSGDGRPEVVLGATPRGGLVEVASSDGMLQVRLGVAPAGGLVETLDAQGKFARTFAVFINPLMRGIVGPPPARPSDKPAGETPDKPASETPEKPTGKTPEPPTETPPATDEPAGEKPSETNDKPAEKPPQP